MGNILKVSLSADRPPQKIRASRKPITVWRLKNYVTKCPDMDTHAAYRTKDL